MIAKNKFKTIIDLVRAFPDEKSCHQYLASQRWIDGVLNCPHEGCGHDKAYVFSDGIRYKCQGCKRIYTAKTNTFMMASKLPTLSWLMAMYLLMHKKGISSMQLAKDLAVTQKTAWFMLHRLRTVLGHAQPDQLDGVVEIDETFVGGASRFKHKNKRPKYNPGRGWKDKTPIFGMLQRGGSVKAVVMTDVLMLTIKKLALQNIKGGSTIYGDGFNGYRALHTFYNVESVDHGRGHYVDGDCHTNTLEGFWSQFKKGTKGVYHKTTPRHLQKYVNEFTFKYNNRTLDAEQQIQCIISNMECRLKYKDLIAA
jgi:transposase-like protein